MADQHQPAAPHRYIVPINVVQEILLEALDIQSVTESVNLDGVTLNTELIIYTELPALEQYEIALDA